MNAKEKPEEKNGSREVKVRLLRQGLRISRRKPQPAGSIALAVTRCR